METISQPLTVLVVDDNHKIRGIIRKILEPVGCRVLDTREEEEAVELFRQNYGLVNVLLLDVSMSPGRGARYVLDELDGILEGVRVILVTGEEPRSVRAAFGEHEISDILQKPFSIAELLDVVAPDLPGPPPPWNDCPLTASRIVSSATPKISAMARLPHPCLWRKRTVTMSVGLRIALGMVGCRWAAGFPPPPVPLRRL